MLLKILSYNIHKGFDWNNKNYFLQEMKEFIKQSRADIVFLQEVVGKNSKYVAQGMVDSQFEFLADQLWPHFSYGHNAVYDHGHHGNLILSKFPIESFENIDLTTNHWE
jgi:endonuclease/exonuclease/phosphatase family metal-dependent hydrolase